MLARHTRCALSTQRRALSTQRYPQFETLASLGQASLECYSERNAMAVKGADGQWRWHTYGDLAAQSSDCRGALRELGVKPGDNVAVISKNRPEWAVGA